MVWSIEGGWIVWLSHVLRPVRSARRRVVQIFAVTVFVIIVILISVRIYVIIALLALLA